MKVLPINFYQKACPSNSDNKSNIAFGMDPGPNFVKTYAELFILLPEEASKMFEGLRKLILQNDGASGDLMRITNSNKFFATFTNKGCYTIGKTFDSPWHLFSEKDGFIKFLRDNIFSNTTYQ